MNYKTLAAFIIFLLLFQPDIFRFFDLNEQQESRFFFEM